MAGRVDVSGRAPPATGTSNVEPRPYTAQSGTERHSLLASSGSPLASGPTTDSGSEQRPTPLQGIAGPGCPRASSQRGPDLEERPSEASRSTAASTAQTA